MKRATESNILLVDDDENDAMLVKHMVKKMPDGGCAFRWAASYDQGLKILGEIGWDVCLVDYQLGSRTGVELVTESRMRGLDTPFLLLTGAGSRAIDLQAMRAGVNGYLEKSRLCPLELERAIRYAIGSRPAREQPGGGESRRVPQEAIELFRAGYLSKQPFIVIALMLDREAVLRNHLSSRHVEHIYSDIEALVRGRISAGESLVRATDNSLLLISTAQESRDARQFLSQLMSEPLSLNQDDRSKSVSLPAILRRNVFSSTAYPGPIPLLAELDEFFEPGPRPVAKESKFF
jgi:CheY-like chemotaxis protein